MNNRLFERFVINYYGNLPKLLKDIDVHIQANGLFLCPMHDNYNTPAAKIFKDINGWAFYCFSEQKQFGSYDVLKEVYKYNMKVYFRTLWSMLNDSQKAEMRDKFGEYDENSEIFCEQYFEMFRNKQIDYKQLVNLLSFESTKDSK